MFLSAETYVFRSGNVGLCVGERRKHKEEGLIIQRGLKDDLEKLG